MRETCSFRFTLINCVTMKITAFIVRLLDPPMFCARSNIEQIVLAKVADRVAFILFVATQNHRIKYSTIAIRNPALPPIKPATNRVNISSLITSPSGMSLELCLFAPISFFAPSGCGLRFAPGQQVTLSLAQSH